MAQGFSEKSDAEKLLLRALAISLFIHLLFFGTWKYGQTHGLWKTFHFPAWMHFTPKAMPPLLMSKKLIPLQPEQPPQLVFVDVDPAAATVTPPKKTKYYSANNSVAANPHPKNLPVPELTGRQNKVVKTTENVKLHPQPLQPAPPIKQEVAKTQSLPEAKPLPKKTYVPGDLVMAKPQEKAPPKIPEKTGEALTAKGDDLQPEPLPVHQRPRTVADAMAQHGMLGEKSRQEGGVGAYRLEPSLDVAKSPFGSYDAMFIEAVRTRWYQLLENRTAEGTGRVVVEFRMHPDGRITDLSMTHNDMTDLLGLICQRAILDPAPYGPWPLEMRREIPNDYRDVTFTFYYSTE